MEGGSSDDWGLLPALSVGTAFVFYVIWAAMVDIAHEESGTTFEWVALVLSVPTFAFLYRIALSRLTRTERSLWLTGTALLLALFSMGGINIILHPKYALDQKLALLFLAAGTPVLGLIGYHLFTNMFGRRDDRRP